MQMHLVNLKAPWREPKLVEVTVKVCPKTVWAIEVGGRRHLVGSSAFQTLPAAERCRRALLENLAKDRFTFFKRPHITRLAQATLKTLH